MSRIFISHSSKDNAKAMAFQHWLATQGWDDVFLDLDPERGLKAGQRWQDALKQASAACELVIVLISPDWAKSQWCITEYLLARQLNKRVFGAFVEPTDRSTLPIELAGELQLVDLVTGPVGFSRDVSPPPGGKIVQVSFAMDGLERMRVGLADAGLDARYFAWPPERDPERPPYRGLKALEAEDAGIFFGRDGPIVEALDQLRGLRDGAAPRMLVVLGASGAGKSSFMRAGLLPRLARDRRHYRTLPVVRLNQAALTGDHGLIACFASALTIAGERTTRAEVRQALEAGAPALARLLAPLARPTGDNDARPMLILPIDQGEEAFQADSGAEAAAALALLNDLLRQDDPPMMAIVTIRSDSYEPLQTAPALDGVTQHAFSLPPLPKGAYGQVIAGPAARLAGTPRPLDIDETLVDAILADIDTGGAKDALPLLAFALERLYREHGGDGDLTLQEYESMGRIRGAIAAAVEQALAAADANPAIPRDRAARLALLKRGLIPWLAGIDPETGAPRRRVARLAEIPPEARPLIDLLVDQRLLATDVSQETGEATIEPSHEALLRQWGLLEDWLEEAFEDLSTAEAVRRASRDWHANDKDAEWLSHRGGRLEVAEQVAALPDFADLFDPAERAYLFAARDAENARLAAATERERRESELELEAAREREAAAKTVARRTLIGLAASLLLAAAAIAAGVYGYEQKSSFQAAALRADMATAAYEGSLELYNDLSVRDTNDASWPWNMPSKLNSVGSMRFREDDFDSAIKAFNESLAISRALTDGPPEGVNLFEEELTSLDGVADALTRSGRLVEALATSEESLRLRRARAEGAPTDFNFKQAVAHNLDDIGDLRMRLGNLAGALAAYQEGLPIHRKLVERAEKNFDPNRTATFDDFFPARNLSFSLARIGDVLLRSGDMAKALSAFQEGLAIRRKLTERYPEDSQLLRDVAVAFRDIADLKRLSGDAEGALAAYQDSFAVSRDLSARTLWPWDEVAALVRLGEVLEATGDESAAYDAFAEGVDIGRELVRRISRDPKSPQHLAIALVRLSNYEENDARDKLLAEAAEILRALRAKRLLSTSQADFLVNLEKELER